MINELNLLEDIDLLSFYTTKNFTNQIYLNVTNQNITLQSFPNQNMKNLNANISFYRRRLNFILYGLKNTCTNFTPFAQISLENDSSLEASLVQLLEFNLGYSANSNPLSSNYFLLYNYVF